MTNFASGMPSVALAHDITASPDGRVWFTTQFNNTLSAADMSGNIAVPTDIDEIGQPFGISAGSDGLLYYALAHASSPEPGFNFVGAANPASGAANEAWFGGGDRSQPQYPTTAPDGLIRVTSSGGGADPNASSIGKIQLATAQSPPSGHALIARAFTPTTSAVPQKITAGPSDTSAVRHPSPLVRRVHDRQDRPGHRGQRGRRPLAGRRQRVPPPAGQRPPGHRAGPDGNLWVTMFGQNKVARVTPPSTFSGIATVTTFDLPVGGNNILGIAAGPDNNMWISQETGNKIIRMNLSGQVTGEFAVTAPRFITTAADGNLWFTANSGPRVGRITTALDPPEHRNTAPIDIPLGSGSGPNLSSLVAVDDEPGFITDVNVRVTGISHTFPDDLDLILVPPNGQAIMLASDVGSAVHSRVATASKQSYPANGITLGFDDSSPFSLRDTMPLVSGIYKPTNIASPSGPNGSDNDGGNPAPTGPFASTLNSQQGFGANGDWRLFVFDDGSTSKDTVGKVFGGWGLDIETEVQINANKAGAGTGTITSSPAGISCAGDGSQCNALFPSESNVVLTANPAAGSRHSLWTGCDSVSGNQCTVDMDAQDVEERNVTATFDLAPSQPAGPTGQRAAALAKCKKIKKRKAKRKCKRKANALPL